MLRRISEPLALSEASLLVLRPALNAPVLNVEYLPVGPARAAIVLFAEEYGGVGLAFGIRATESGQVAVFRNREPIDEMAPLQDALEPALAAAERMGFLFDEDMIEGSAPGGQGRTEATALWGRLMGNVEMPPPPKAAPPIPAATEPILDLTETVPTDEVVAELVLEDVAAADPLGPILDEVAPLEISEPPAEETSLSEVTAQMAAKPAPQKTKGTPRSAPPAPALSKFRQADAATTPAEAAESSASETTGQLGRVPLVRVRRGAESRKRIPYLARLLSSF
jgi:hypothetical protein